MNAAAKSSTVRLYVALAGLVTAVVSLLGAVVRLAWVLVTALTSVIQRWVARRAPKPAVAPPAAFRPYETAASVMAPQVATTLVPPCPAPLARTEYMVPQLPRSAPQLAPPPVAAARPQAPRPVALAPRAFALPSIDYLAGETVDAAVDSDKLQAKAEKLVETLAQYGVQGTVEDILPGPTVTTYEVAPTAGTKVSKVANLADDLSLALASKVRIMAPIPGKNRIGFELPNEKQVRVVLRDLVEDPRFQSLDVPLPVVLGRDTVGNPVYADLASMPHVIVAGATGAGKSVGLNVMLMSLLYRRTPAELRLLMIDPKVVELAPFNRMPHMLLPVVTDMKKAAAALKWAVDEMERRYQLLADAGTRNVVSYNAWVDRVSRGEAPAPSGATPQKLPWIVIVVDEFADLMQQQGKEVEASVTRLAQKARASGMHVILATQRPSANVITGDIKANFPTRIAYRVAQGVDSRIILDEQGAEQLVGNGDMLVKLNGASDTKRVQCPWVSEEEVARVTSFLRSQGEPVYDQTILNALSEEMAAKPARGLKLVARNGGAVAAAAR